MNNNPDCHPETPESGQQTCQNCALTTRALVGGLFESNSFKWCRVWKQLKSKDHPVCSHFEPIDPEPEPEPEPKLVRRSTYDPTWAIEPDTPPVRLMTMRKTPKNPNFAHQKRHKKRQNPTLA